MSIDIEQLSGEIIRQLQVYNEDVTQRVKANAEKIAKKYSKELRKTSPRLMGEYARNWTQKEVAKGRYKSVYKVFNKNEYPLTHLLENGHRVYGKGQAAPRLHIANAEQKAIDEFIKAVSDEL